LARVYGDCIEHMAEEPVKLLGNLNRNIDLINILNEKFRIEVQNWINTKKRNLEKQIRPSEEEKEEFNYNYREGLKIVKQLLIVFPRNKEFLRLGLHYANNWNTEYFKKAEIQEEHIRESSATGERIKGIIKEFSNFFADALIEQCGSGDGNGLKSENKEIATHFYFKAMVENQKMPGTLIEQILRWDSEHDKIFWFYIDFLKKEKNKNRLTKQVMLVRLQELMKLAKSNSRIRETLENNINYLL